MKNLMQIDTESYQSQPILIDVIEKLQHQFGNHALADDEAIQLALHRADPSGNAFNLHFQMLSLNHLTSVYDYQEVFTEVLNQVDQNTPAYHKFKAAYDRISQWYQDQVRQFKNPANNLMHQPDDPNRVQYLITYADLLTMSKAIQAPISEG